MPRFAAHQRNKKNNTTVAYNNKKPPAMEVTSRKNPVTTPTPNNKTKMGGLAGKRPEGTNCAHPKLNQLGQPSPKKINEQFNVKKCGNDTN